jgi:hypothetical protein
MITVVPGEVDDAVEVAIRSGNLPIRSRRKFLRFK